MLEKGLSGEDVVGQIYRAVFDMDVSGKKLVALMDMIGEVDFRLTEGANERIQLDALLAHFALAEEQ